MIKCIEWNFKKKIPEISLLTILGRLEGDLNIMYNITSIYTNQLLINSFTDI